MCGAPHKDPVTKCRLCGQNMATLAAVPVSTAGARQVAAPKKGIGLFIVIALVIIVVIAAGALVFGLTRDSDTVDEATRKIPGLNETVNGWVTIEDLAGGFTASMPPDNTSDLASAQPSPPAAGRWVGEIGDETTISITYYDVTNTTGDIPMNFLKDFAANLANGRPDAKLNEPMGETGFAGYPALDVSMRFPGKDESAKMVLVLKGKRVYVIESLSVYPDHPSFDEVTSGFTFVKATSTTQPGA